MIPKEKAEQLLNKCKFSLYNNLPSFHSETFKNSMIKTSKECALITVDEIINSRPLEPNNVDWDDCGATHKYWYDAQKEAALKFWQEVKQELEKL
jgi:hypothetical protein